MAESKAGIVVLTAAITALITAVFWVGLGVIAYFYFFSGQPPFLVNITSPDRAALGDEINLTIEVSNPTDEEITLGSIDILDGLLDGFEVLNVNPQPDSQDGSLGFLTLYYDQTLAAETTFEVTLTLEATAQGVWTGDIDCCDPMEKFITSSRTIVVTAPEEDE